MTRLKHSKLKRCLKTFSLVPQRTSFQRWQSRWIDFDRLLDMFFSASRSFVEFVKCYLCSEEPHFQWAEVHVADQRSHKVTGRKKWSCHLVKLSKTTCESSFQTCSPLISCWIFIKIWDLQEAVHSAVQAGSYTSHNASFITTLLPVECPRSHFVMQVFCCKFGVKVILHTLEKSQSTLKSSLVSNQCSAPLTWPTFAKLK